MTFALRLKELRSSLRESAGTIVFGMEDGTVSIFGLIFGVAATTTNAGTVLIAGASGPVAAAVSMMAGAFLDAETTSDETKAKRAALQSGCPGILPPSAPSFPANWRRPVYRSSSLRH